jgi:hypothetical protein
MLVQAIVLLASVQRAALATAAAAREVGRSVLLAANATDAQVRADRSLAAIAADHGFARHQFDVAVDRGGAVGDRITVDVRTDVPVLRLPILGAVWPSLAVPVHASFTGDVDRYRSFDATSR